MQNRSSIGRLSAACAGRAWPWVLAVTLGLTGCTLMAPQPAGPADTPPTDATPPADATALTPDWKPFTLPGKRATQYQLTTKDGRWAIEAQADASASMLRRSVDLPVDQLGDVEWSWMIDAPLAEADLGVAERADSPARLVFAFEGDRSRLSPRTRMLFELAKALTGEEPPYATLVYAWSTRTPTETVLHNARSDRIRKIVVDSGAQHAKSWRHYRRHLAADFQRAFGEPPGRLIGVALMTDADNTRSRAHAWYGRILFHPPPPACKPAQGTSCSAAKS